MLSSNPTYPQMKPSGIDWLGDIPAHWNVERLKFLTDCYDGKRVPVSAELRGDMLGEYPYWGANGIVDYVDKWLFDEELVLLGEDGAPFFDKTKPVAFFVDGKVWINNHIHVFKATTIDSIFLVHSLNCVEYGTFIDGSTRDKLTQGDAANISIAVPPIEEQQAIADYLDRKTAQIDAVVREKEAQIELLGEHRQALISHAVTHGLNPAAPVKPSGIVWLGDIPAHWEVERLKFSCDKIGSGKTPRGGAEIYSDSGIIFLRSQNVYDDGLRLDDVVYISSDIDEEMANTRVSPHDVLLNITGASIGRTCIVPDDFPPANVNQHVCIIRISRRLVPAYLSYYLKSYAIKEQILSLENGSSREGLNFEQIGNLVVNYPFDSPEEQREIADYLDRETARIDGIVQTVQSQIERLREYRQAVISAAVTGKIAPESLF